MRHSRTIAHTHTAAVVVVVAVDAFGIILNEVRFISIYNVNVANFFYSREEINKKGAKIWLNACEPVCSNEWMNEWWMILLFFCDVRSTHILLAIQMDKWTKEETAQCALNPQRATLRINQIRAKKRMAAAKFGVRDHSKALFSNNYLLLLHFWLQWEKISWNAH